MVYFNQTPPDNRPRPPNSPADNQPGNPPVVGGNPPHAGGNLPNNVQMPQSLYGDYLGGQPPIVPIPPGQRRVGGTVQLPNWVPSWFPRDAQTLLIIFGGGGLLTLLVFGVCAALTLSAILSPRNAATATPIASATATGVAIIVTATPGEIPTLVLPTIGIEPTTPSSLFPPTAVNPYQAANLEGMQAVQIELYDSGINNYRITSQFMAGNPQVALFGTALNIANYTVDRDANCPDYMRLTIMRADGSFALFTACLKSKTVVLRGLPEFNEQDLPMGPYFVDILKPHLPEVYRNLLN